MDTKNRKTSCNQRDGCTLDCVFCDRIAATTDVATLEEEHDAIVATQSQTIGNSPAHEDPESWKRRDTTLAEFARKLEIISARLAELNQKERKRV